MVNKCLAVGCRNGNVSTRKIGPPTSAFCLPWSHPDLVPYWVKFLNRPDFKPDPKSTSQVICADHFEEKYLKRGNKRVYLDFSLNLVPTIQAASASGKHSPVVWFWVKLHRKATRFNTLKCRYLICRSSRFVVVHFNSFSQPPRTLVKHKTSPKRPKNRAELCSNF